MWFIRCIKCNLSVLTAILHFNLVLVLDDLSAKSTGQWHSTGFCPSHHLSILLGIHSRVVTHHSIALTWPTYTSVKPSSRFHGHNMFREIGCLLWKKCTIPWNLWFLIHFNVFCCTSAAFLLCSPLCPPPLRPCLYKSYFGPKMHANEYSMTFALFVCNTHCEFSRKLAYFQNPPTL